MTGGEDSAVDSSRVRPLLLAAGRLGLARLRLARAELDLHVQDRARALVSEVAAVGFAVLALGAVLTGIVLSLPDDTRSPTLVLAAAVFAAGALLCARHAQSAWSRPLFPASLAEFEADLRALHGEPPQAGKDSSAVGNAAGHPGNIP